MKKISGKIQEIRITRLNLIFLKKKKNSNIQARESYLFYFIFHYLTIYIYVIKFGQYANISWVILNGNRIKDFCFKLLETIYIIVYTYVIYV